MTPEKLKEIEQRANSADIPTLAAEVKRLQDEVHFLNQILKAVGVERKRAAIKEWASQHPCSPEDKQALNDLLDVILSDSRDL